MALGFIKNILKKRHIDKPQTQSGMLEPHGNIRLEVPVTFTFTQDEIDRYGFSGIEQLKNPRIQDKLKRCIG